MTTDRRSIPDRETAAQLANGYTVAWCIAPDGEPWPWLVAPIFCEECDAAASHGSRDDMPAHERTGRLPREYLVFRCGVPTRRGSPCRQVVRESGLPCAVHRAAAARRGSG